MFPFGIKILPTRRAFHHQTTRILFGNRQFCLAKLADVGDVLVTATPTFDIARLKEHVCNIRVARFGRMRLEQFFDRNINGHLSNIPNANLVCINANLNRRGPGIITMNHSIQKQLAECLLREKECFLAVNAVVADESLHVLRIDEIHRLFNLHHKRTVNLILIDNIRIVIGEEPNFCISAHDPLFGIRVKAHDSRPRQIFILKQPQISQKNICRNIQRLAIKTIMVERHFLE